MLDQLFPLAQQTVPRLDSLYWLMLASRILHITGAMILVGGLFYIRAVVSPVVAHDGASGGPADADRLFGGRRAAWAMWVGIATLLLLATGLLNYVQMIRMHEKLAPSYHMLAGLKMLAGLALFFLAALLAGRSAAAQMLRSKFHLWLTVCLLLGILTAAFGSVLRTYPRILKIDGAPRSTLLAPQP